MTYTAKLLGDEWWVYDRLSGSYPIALTGYGVVKQGFAENHQELALAEADKLNKAFGRPT